MRECGRNFSIPVGTVPMYSPTVGTKLDYTYHVVRNKSNITVAIYVVSGKGIVRVGGRQFVAVPGQIYVLPRGVDHEYWGVPEDPWCHIYANFRGQFATTILQEYGLGDTYCFPGEGLRGEFSVIEEILDSTEPEPMIQSRLVGFYNRLVYRLAVSQMDASYSAEALVLHEYLVENLDRIVTNQELADQIYRSVDYCVKLFNREYGTTPYNFQLNEKMRVAKGLLSDTTLPIAEIGQRLGYRDTCYFSGLFKSKAGMSPRAYRKRARVDTGSSKADWLKQMRDYFCDFLVMFNYPEKSQLALREAYEWISYNDQATEMFRDLMNVYEENKNCDYEMLVKKMDEISKLIGIHKYTGWLVLYIGMSRQLKEYYREAGIDESVWRNSMMDLKYKLMECKEVYDIWGTFTNWFSGFFRMTRFALGRLQFDMTTFGRYYNKNGVALTPESRALGVHIPRTMTKLDRQSVRQSYARASEFFRDWLGDGHTVFICGSWLLFPRHRELLSTESNILAFMNEFDVIDSGLYEDYHEIWRLFDRNYTPQLDLLPQDSTLRRKYVDLMRKGEKTGWGFGVYVYN